MPEDSTEPTRQARPSDPPPIVTAVARAYRCPDCIADVSLGVNAHGIYRLTIAHDDTCPTYRAMTRRR